jgi:hypothetical protein
MLVVSVQCLTTEQPQLWLDVMALALHEFVTTTHVW